MIKRCIRACMLRYLYIRYTVRQSNVKVEVAIKTTKRIILDDVDPDGSLHSDNAARALLQYRNTPLPEINFSLAQFFIAGNFDIMCQSVQTIHCLHKDWVVSSKQIENYAHCQNQYLKEQYDHKATHELPVMHAGTKTSETIFSYHTPHYFITK